MTKKIIESAVVILKGVDRTVGRVEKEVEAVIQPVQKTAFARFPVPFTLLVTFGVAATFFGFEKVLTEVAYINDRPFLMLSIGVGVLTITGTLYKKLG
ncbi:MAG: hypothetical protein ACI92I_000417 [Acidimicrobiales bacterium]|jgi:hypothetical protein